MDDIGLLRVVNRQVAPTAMWGIHDTDVLSPTGEGDVTVAKASPQEVGLEIKRHLVRVPRRLRKWWMARRTLQIVGELTNEQLADAGIDLASVTGPISIQVVKRGYQANVAGWR